MNGLLQDVRHALRQLRRTPGFTVAVVATLAFAIGANTAIFSVVNALILKSLPYPDPERVGTIYTRIAGSNVSDERHSLDGEQWELLRDHVPALISAVFSRINSGVNLRFGSRVQYVQGGRISARYFDVLGLQPIMGRTFSEEEDRRHGPTSVILSYRLWRNVLGSTPDILGKPLLLKGEPYTVIGVLPEGAITPLNADVYTALQPAQDGEGAGTNFACITRLRDGATWPEADAEINRTWSARSSRYELNGNPGAKITYHSVQLQRGETDSLRPQLLALMLATGFILLIACANLAGLMLVRMLRRAPEVATRLALGASRWQIQKQFWAENLVLALGGGAIGIGVGFLSLRGLLLLLPQHFLPAAHISLDGRVLAFTLIVSLLTSILFGMFPALLTRRVTMRSSAHRGETKVGGLGLRRGLIAGEVALTVILLVSSGLLVRSLVHLETLPPGFSPDGVLVAKASLDDVHFHDPAAFRKLMDESTAAMRRIPGVQDAAVGLSLPYEQALNSPVTLRDGKETGQHVQTDVSYVTPGYFKALELPVLAGRAFSDADGPNSQPVAIVNQAFARKFYGGANPVGRYIDKDTLIVGEVADVYVVSGLYSGAPLMSDQQMYVPATQVPGQLLALVHAWFQPDWIVRTARPVEGLTAQMQGALASADPNLPFSGFYRMQDLLARTLAMQRVEVALLGAMAVLALLLSAIGIFALVSHLVVQRTHEIGIRMALGAQRASVVRLVVGDGTWPALAGLAVGTLAAAGLSRFMAAVLFGITTTDPLTFSCVGVLLALIAAFASYIPARRAAKVDPMVALRYE